MLTDNQVRSYLEDHYKIACDLAGLGTKSGAIKLMGKKKKNQNRSIKSGYYVRLQNFDTLREAKKSMSDRNVRYIIRCIQFKVAKSHFWRLQNGTHLSEKSRIQKQSTGTTETAGIRATLQNTLQT